MSDKVYTGSVHALLAAQVRLYQVTGDARWLESAHKTATSLLGVRSATGAFPAEVRIRNGELRVSGSRLSGMADYQGIYALASYVRETNDSKARVALENLTQRARRDWQAKKKEGDASLAELAWLVNGFREIYEITQNRQDAKLALEVADWLIKYQYDGPDGRRGAFRNTPKDEYFYTRGTGKVAEALADAVVLAKKIGGDVAKYENALQRVLLWLMQMQYTETNTYFVSPQITSRIAGAVRGHLLNIRAPLDSAGHFAAAGLMYLRELNR